MIINYPAGGPTDIEGRIIAQHLPKHIPGKPTIVIKNVAGAGGIIGTNQLGEAAPNGDSHRLLHPGHHCRVREQSGAARQLRGFRDDRRGGEPAGGLHAQGYAARPQGPDRHHEGQRVQGAVAQRPEQQHLNQSLSLDLLGVKYQAVPAYRGLKDVETAILQNLGQLANTSLPGWTGSAEPTLGDIVMPMWQLATRGKDGSYPRSPALSEPADVRGILRQR